MRVTGFQIQKKASIDTIVKFKARLSGYYTQSMQSFQPTRSTNQTKYVNEREVLGS